MTVTAPAHLDLDEHTLETFRERAAVDDAANTFFDDTHRDLLAAGHYTANLPEEAGGGGLDLVEMGRRQRLLARYAPAPALASTMHLYWTGAAADVRRMGLNDLDLVVEGAAAGDIFASGHAEAGNDLPTTRSTTVAEPVVGGYRLTGRKHFGSLGPVWTQLGLHALDATDPADPKIVHAFVRRDDAGVEVVENWDTMTMRASQSYDTVLDAVFVPHERVVAVCGAADHSPMLGAFFTWALTLFSNVYVGVAERAIELAVASATERTSIGLDGRTLAHNPMVQHQVAEAWMAVDGVRSQLEHLAADWVGTHVGPDWLARIMGAKHRTAVETRRAVDVCAQIVGGSSIRSDDELGRLWRDSRGITFHPPPDALAHELVAKTVLGIDPTGPRW